MVFLILVSILSALAVCSLFLWDRKQKVFFIKRNVHYVPSPLFGGSLLDVLLLRKSVASVMLDLYREASEKNLPFIGARFLHKNVLVLRDLNVIKRVLVQDFNQFSDRAAAANPHKDPFGGYNLFLLKNPKWHDLRKKITPVFTSSRMRLFFEDINGIGKRLHSQLLRDVPAEKEFTLGSLMGSYTTDVYASCSFGIEVNFIENPQSEFGNIALKMFHFKVSRALEFGSAFLCPEIAKVWPTYFFSKQGCKYLKEMLTAVLEERGAKSTTRNDLMDVILQIKSGQEVMAADNESPVYSDEMLLAQSVIFFVAGFETTGTALTHTLYELARNPDVQLKVKEEIAGHLKTHGKLTYENLAELKYITMVCLEVFRLYPAFSFLSREFTPENKKASMYSSCLDCDLPAGTPVYIPIYGLHRDPKIFPNPEIFDPQRFSSENFAKIPKGAYLPFGSGPRQCIAERLAYMAMKIGLFNVLRDYSVEMCERTPTAISPHKLATLVVPDREIFVCLRRDAGKF